MYICNKNNSKILILNNNNRIVFFAEMKFINAENDIEEYTKQTNIRRVTYFCNFCKIKAYSVGKNIQ